MDVGFRDPQTQRLFNEHDRLEARYGADLALRDATRLAVMVAARDLSVLPSSPPIGLKAVAGAEGQFAVDLGPRHRLRFAGLHDPKRRRRGLSAIDRVEILAVEEIGPASKHRSRDR